MGREGIASNVLRRCGSTATIRATAEGQNRTIACRSSPEPTDAIRVLRLEVQSVSSLDAIESRRSPTRRNSVVSIALHHNQNRLDQLFSVDVAGVLCTRHRVDSQGHAARSTSRHSTTSLRFTHQTRLVRAPKLSSISRRSGPRLPTCPSANLMLELGFGACDLVVCEH
jgi:hypothetical protein